MSAKKMVNVSLMSQEETNVKRADLRNVYKSI